MMILAAALFLLGCASEQKTEQAAIAALEKQLEASADPQQAESLLGLYRDYIAQYPDDAVQNATYLYRTASVLYRLNRFSEALKPLEEVLRSHHASSQAAEAAMFMGHIHEDKLRNTQTALTIWQLMATAFPNYEKKGEVAAKTTALGLPSLEERMEQMAAKSVTEDGRLNFEAANTYIQSCEAHALLLPADTGSPELLYKASEMARATRNFPKAMATYDWITAQYPDYEKRSQILFIQAFTLDNDLKEYDKAKVLYEQFLALYPNDGFADDVTFLLKNLGKTDEEILSTFE